MDNKLVDLGLIESLEVGKAEYDDYIRNGLMVQLRRLEPGADIEEAHMRNRQLVAAWAFEKGKKDNVIERLQKMGKPILKFTITKNCALSLAICCAKFNALNRKATIMQAKCWWKITGKSG